MFTLIIYHDKIILLKEIVMNIKEELIRRYSYLYENKELILAMCINIVEVKPNERKQELEKLKREYKKLSADKMIINNVETTIKNVDGSTYEYYLFKDVSSEIVDLYEDFLLGNLPLEETGLYKHIEGVKNSPVYLEGFNNMINALEEEKEYAFKKHTNIYCMENIILCKKKEY